MSPNASTNLRMLRRGPEEDLETDYGLSMGEGMLEIPSPGAVQEVTSGEDQPIEYPSK